MQYGSFFFVAAVTAFALSASAAPALKADLKNETVEVRAGEKLVTAYTFSHDQKYPWFYPVNGPVSGKSVTTESSQPYPHHHSLFFGCDKVNGANYWQDSHARGQILSQGPAIVKAEGDAVIFTDTCLWKQPAKDPVIRDERHVTITMPSQDLYYIDFVITLHPLVDIHIAKTNHSLFSARMRPELSVESGGVIRNAKGSKDSAGAHGAESPWCDYSGTEDGVTEGLAIFQHPENEWYPSRFFTRDYGFFSPTPLNWLEDGYAIPKEKPLTLRYRVVVHAGDAAQADIPALFEAWKAGKQQMHG
jgi:hypothetical protein